MVAAVPREVYEADERPFADGRRYPAKAVRRDPVPSASLGCSTVRLGERYELVVGRLATPRKLHVWQRWPFAAHRLRVYAERSATFCSSHVGSGYDRRA